MTDQPQPGRECRHANKTRLGTTYCEWAWSEDVVCPPWLLDEAPPVLPTDGADCQAFEPKDYADDE